MNKTAVIFQSKYGATKRYAQWLAEALSCDIFDRKAVKATDLDPYDTIVYGGGLYAGGVLGIDLLTKNFDRLLDKNLILFTCGLADPADSSNTGNIRQSLNRVLTAPMREKVKIFHLRGAIDYRKLGAADKAMMALLHKMTLKKDYDSLRNEDKEMLATYGQVVDFTDKAALLPLVDYIRGLGV